MNKVDEASFNLDENRMIALLRQSLELNEYEAKTYFSMLLLGRPHSAKDICQKVDIFAGGIKQVVVEISARAPGNTVGDYIEDKADNPAANDRGNDDSSDSYR